MKHKAPGFMHDCHDVPNHHEHHEHDHHCPPPVFIDDLNEPGPPIKHKYHIPTHHLCMINVISLKPRICRHHQV